MIFCPNKLQSNFHKDIDIFYVRDVGWLFIHFVLSSNITMVARLSVKLGNFHLFIKSQRISSSVVIDLCNSLRRIKSIDLFSFTVVIFLQSKVFMIKLSYVFLAVSWTNVFNYFVLGVQNDIS